MVNIAKITKKRLGELLLAEGLITNEQIEEALKEQQKTPGMLLGEVLVKLGYVTEYDIAGALAAQFGLPYIDATKYIITKEVFGLLPPDFIKSNQVVPLDKIGNILTIVVAGTLSGKVFEEIEKKTGCEVYPFVSTVSQIRQVIQNHSTEGEPAAGKKK
jgi:type IV pilus assembly protein PilB